MARRLLRCGRQPQLQRLLSRQCMTLSSRYTAAACGLKSFLVNDCKTEVYKGRMLSQL